MIGKIGLGPVFTYDMISQSRRWQFYAGRVLFVLLLLIGMTIVWCTFSPTNQPLATVQTHRQLAEIGKNFYFALAGIQISFILLVAPAATAGSICVDRARGTLLHMLVTDLTDAEIVLGRLGARLVPVFGLLACSLPVMTLAGLLGGIDFGTLVGLYVISVALSILGCSLALAFSIKAARTHEVLMAVYMIFGIWMISLGIWWNMPGAKIMVPPDWFQKANPYVLAYAPYLRPGFAQPIDFAIFLGIVLVASIAIVAWSILRLRQAVVESAGRSEKSSRRIGLTRRLLPSWTGPTLDGNPVLWREWHRNRPSRLARWLWRVLYGVTWGLAAWGVWDIVTEGRFDNNSPLRLGFILQVLFGMLMVAAASPTVLAEERTRGSLDILLSTPLSTRSIVFAKWWGAYRIVLGLAPLPAFAVVFAALSCPDVPFFAGAARWVKPPAPLSQYDRIMAVICSISDLLVSGALLVSSGVALATWVPRIGRAVGISVILYFVLGFGLPVGFEIVFMRYFRNYSGASWSHNQWLMQAITSLSPSVGPTTAFQALLGFAFEPRDFLWDCLIEVILSKLVVAVILLWLTLRTFNRCLGRVVESRPASFRPPLGPPSPRASRLRPARELEPELVEVNDSPSPLP